MWERETEAPGARETGIQSGGGGLAGQGHMSCCRCKKQKMGLDTGIMRL